ncbi:hypothetical protein ACKKBG_A07035 [Auxenochlorella protothecoides x Auxenochlorella symbiontica]
MPLSLGSTRSLTRVLPGTLSSRRKHATRRTRLTATAVMNQIRIRSKAKQLLDAGCQIHEFGGQTLEEGGFGDDVAALQAFLSERAYFNAGEGFSGYFGSVTKEALCDWQRDSGLEVTGSFNTASHLEYLRQKAGQAAVASTGAAGVAASVSVASENPGHLQAFVAPALPAGALGLAATLVTIVLGVLAKRQAPRAVPVLQARESASLDAPVAQHSEVGRQARSTTGTPEPSPEGGAFVPGQRRTRPLTDEELQRRLAALKGQPPASLPVQRTAPKPLPGVEEYATSLPSRYGHYYGGKAVYNQVKQLLVAEGSGVGLAPTLPATGLRTPKPSAAQARRGPAQPGHPRPRQAGHAAVTAGRVARPDPAREQAAQAGPQHFADVRGPEQVPAGPGRPGPRMAPAPALLVGTDLAPLPDRPGDPVPGGAAPLNPRLTVAEAARQAALAAGEAAAATEGGQQAVPLSGDTVVLAHQPIRLHKPARLARS